MSSTITMTIQNVTSRKTRYGDDYADLTGTDGQTVRVWGDAARFARLFIGSAVQIVDEIKIYSAGYAA